MPTLRRRPAAAAARRPRKGVSIIEIVIAMTLLSLVIGSLGLLSARTAAKARALDMLSARTFVLMQQSNRFSVLPYDSIPVYAPRTDTVIAGRFKYLRRVTYTQSKTGSEYKNVQVILTPLSDPTRHDTLTFQRAKTYAKSPLFI
jgi:hypothetical protein